jgi:hypothetical protein
LLIPERIKCEAVEISPEHRDKILYRLTALWAFIESGLGGILHALKFPFTGLIIAGFALLLITLILHYSGKNKKFIFTSLMIVLLVKMVLSPHTSPTAYFAVTFQALTLYAIVKLFGLNRFALFAGFVIAILESAFQKLIVLTLVGGFTFWHSVQSFIEWVQQSVFSSAGFLSVKLMVFIYLSIYLVGAILWAWLTFRILNDLQRHLFANRALQLDDVNDLDTVPKSQRKSFIFLILMICIVVTGLAWMGFRQKDVLFYLLRVISIIFLWYYIIGPLLTGLIKKYLYKKMPSYQAKVDDVLDIFPKIKKVVTYNWLISAKYRFLERIYQFILGTIVMVLALE